MQLSNLPDRLLGLVFPPRCVGCGKDGRYLCASCFSSLRWLSPPYCNVCAQPISSGVLCQRCRQHPLEIDGVRAQFVMEGAIREAIHRLKYNHLKALAPVLGELLFKYLSRNPIPSDIIMLVPLHPRRERERGYNQSALIARSISRRTLLPLMNNGLVRVRDAPAQAKAADIQHRRANVAGVSFGKEKASRGRGCS